MSSDDASTSQEHAAAVARPRAKKPKSSGVELSPTSDSAPKQRRPRKDPNAPAKAVPAARLAPAPTPDESDDDEPEFDMIVPFPPLDPAAVADECPFDTSFASFASVFDPTLDVSTLLCSARSSRAPASQRLHVTRISIYRELAEEYFGRFLKETPDVTDEDLKERAQQKADRGAQRSSTRVGRKPVTLHQPQQESPEQLRMIFCEQLNRCEADRVSSSAGRSEKTGLVVVTPLPMSQQLKSLAATDPVSLQRVMREDSHVPATLHDYYRLSPDERRALHGHSGTSPTPINPHFDLFQYAPFVVADQYEEILDDLSHKMRQTSDEHPTLPTCHATNGRTQARSAEAVREGGTQGTSRAEAVEDIKSDQQIPSGPTEDTVMTSPVPILPVLSPVPVAEPASSVCSPQGQPDLPAPTAALGDADTPTDSSLPTVAEPPGASSEPPLVSPETTSEPHLSESVTSTPTAHGTDAAAAPPLLPPSAVCTLPATSHGVGMFASLDFNSPNCGQFRSHWTNSCFQWKFDNQSRTFSAVAFDASNRLDNDMAHVTGIIQQAQKDFHDDMVQDEADERIIEQEIEKQSRRPRAKKTARYGEEKEEVTKRSMTDEERSPSPDSSCPSPTPPSVGPFTPGSSHYLQLKSRIRESFKSAVAQSLFLPHTYLRDVAPHLHSRAIRMSEQCVRDLATKFTLPSEEQSVDSVFGLVVPGFGCAGTQVFVKVGLCLTLLHDEIGWCSALNYMTTRSRGCALWIGLNMHKASVKWSKDRLRHLINAQTFNLSEFLAHMRKSGLQPSMQVQFPGTCIYSPQGSGAAHIVLTVGSWVEQVAINYSMAPKGLASAMHFWDGADTLLHNSALATRCVIPLMWLQKHRGWDVGLADQLRVLDALDRQVRVEGRYVIQYRDYSSPTDLEVYCKRCFNGTTNRRAILFMRIDQMCPACFVDRHEEYMHWTTMIDKRFK